MLQVATQNVWAAQNGLVENNRLWLRDEECLCGIEDALS